MRKLHIFLLILLFSSVNLLGQSKTQPTQGSYFKVHFKRKGSAIFNYSEKNYRHATIDFVNKKNVDTTIVKHIDLDKPTIFTIVLMLKNSNMMYKFIGFNQGDTISLEVKDTTLSYSGNDKRMMLFNEMANAAEYFSSFVKPYTIAEYDNRKQVSETEKSDRLKRLTTFLKENKMDSQSIQIFKNYIDLCYYNQLLAVNYPKSLTPGWKHPDIARLDSIDNKNTLLLSINSNEVREILYYLIQYNANLNNKLDKTIFENIPLLNSRLHKTKMLDGLIFDRLESFIKSLQEHRLILESLKNYMLDNTDETIALANLKISKEVLNVKLTSYDGKTTLFDQLLKDNHKIIVLDFWASWCAPCIAQIPKLKEAIAKLSNTIKFISISSDKDSLKWIEGCNKYNVNENSFLLSDISNNILLKSFGVTQYPTFIVITNLGEILCKDFLRPSDAKFGVELLRMLEAL